MNPPVDDSVAPQQNVWHAMTELVRARFLPLTNVMSLVSAMLLLIGVYLVNTAEGVKESSCQVITLLGVMQVYEAALIAGAWFLIRRVRHVKSGLVLVAIEILFMPDITFITDNLPVHGAVAWPIVGIWIGLTVTKFTLLARVLGLQVSRAAFALVGLGAAFIVSVPLLGLFKLMADKHLPHFIAAATFALFLLHRWRPPQIIGGIPGVRSSPGVGWFSKNVWLIWAGLLGLHLFNWHYTMVPVSLVYLSALLAIASLNIAEQNLTFVVLAFAAAIGFNDPQTAWVTFGICLASSLHLFAVRRGQPYLTAALFFAYAVVWSILRGRGLQGNDEATAMLLADGALVVGAVAATLRTGYRPHLLAALYGLGGVFHHLKAASRLDGLLRAIARLDRQTVGVVFIVTAFVLLGLLLLWHSKVPLKHEHPPDETDESSRA